MVLVVIVVAVVCLLKRGRLGCLKGSNQMVVRKLNRSQ